jgi:toxin FitB
LTIVDSVGWIEFISRGPMAKDYRGYILNSDHLLTPTIIVYEVHKRVLISLGEEAAYDAASTIMETTLIPLSHALSISAAEISIKHKLPMADAIIYATALAHRAILVTSDAHFQGLPHVEYIPRPSA